MFRAMSCCRSHSAQAGQGAVPAVDSRMECVSSVESGSVLALRLTPMNPHFTLVLCVEMNRALEDRCDGG